MQVKFSNCLNGNMYTLNMITSTATRVKGHDHITILELKKTHPNLNSKSQYQFRCLSVYRIISERCLSVYRIISDRCLSVYRIISERCLSVYRIISERRLSVYRIVSEICLSVYTLFLKGVCPCIDCF